MLIDQVFKYPGWSDELRYCYDNFPELKIVFTGSSVMRLKEENSALSGLVDSYNLRGFSFREYINLLAGTDLSSVTLDDIITRHKEIAHEIYAAVNPQEYLQGYFCLLYTSTASEESKSERVPVKSLLMNGFWDNWFISAGAGADVYLGQQDSKYGFGDRITPSFNINVGKWFTPVIGLRLGADYYGMRGLTTGCLLYTSTIFI